MRDQRFLFTVCPHFAHTLLHLYITFVFNRIEKSVKYIMCVKLLQANYLTFNKIWID